MFAYLDILSQDIHQKLGCGKIKGAQVLGQMTINSFISTEDIKQVVDKKFNQNSKIRRFHSSVNWKSLPIIRISCYSEISLKLLLEGIDIFGKHYNCEQYKKPVIRYSIAETKYGTETLIIIAEWVSYLKILLINMAFT